MAEKIVLIVLDRVVAIYECIKVGRKQKGKETIKTLTQSWSLATDTLGIME